ncbi:hypothetical protein [Parvularcula sp. IMCC14364]|nr:hypothetical protein [Parvularcula sp. IMCC14364]
MEGTLIGTDVTAYVAASWAISILILGGLVGWAVNAAIRSDKR